MQLFHCRSCPIVTFILYKSKPLFHVYVKDWTKFFEYFDKFRFRKLRVEITYVNIRISSSPGWPPSWGRLAALASTGFLSSWRTPRLPTAWWGSTLMPTATPLLFALTRRWLFLFLNLPSIPSFIRWNRLRLLRIFTSYFGVLSYLFPLAWFRICLSFFWRSWRKFTWFFWAFRFTFICRWWHFIIIII